MADDFESYWRVDCQLYFLVADSVNVNPDVVSDVQGFGGLSGQCE
jgi:hypothetical protein